MVDPVPRSDRLTTHHQGGSMTNWINYILLFLVAAALVVFFISDSRRWTTFAFTVLTVFVFAINLQFWSLGFALSKLVTYLMALLILNLVRTGSGESIFSESRSGTLFKLAVLVFGFLFIIILGQGITGFLAMDLEQVIAALFLIYAGLMQLGISKHYYRAILGIFAFFMGFEVIYGSIEQSLLINGMLAAIILSIAMIGAYIQIATKGDDLR